MLTLPRTVSTDPRTGATVYGNVYTQLLEYIISADLVFYALMVAAVIVLRRRRPEAPRPYRTHGYPLVPALYVLLAALVVLDLAYLAPASGASEHGRPTSTTGAEKSSAARRPRPVVRGGAA
jgi:basic amino acid/polyamine antiporter, APA family